MTPFSLKYIEAPQRAAFKVSRRAAVRETCCPKKLGAPAATLAGHFPVNAVRMFELSPHAIANWEPISEYRYLARIQSRIAFPEPSATELRITDANYIQGISTGRTEVESKEEARKRGQTSPNRAEALVMAFCKIVPQEQTFYLGAPVQISAI
jgi:hypothetical protein